ncbi:MAG: hypothetical protein ACRDRL_02505 [Sciscionella sp.]
MTWRPGVFRASIHGIEPDVAHRSVRCANGYRVWADRDRDRDLAVYQLGGVSIVVAGGKQPVMHLTADSHGGVYRALTQLGYHYADIITVAIGGETVRP